MARHVQGGQHASLCSSGSARFCRRSCEAAVVAIEGLDRLLRDRRQCSPVAVGPLDSWIEGLPELRGGTT